MIFYPILFSSYDYVRIGTSGLIFLINSRTRKDIPGPNAPIIPSFVTLISATYVTSPKVVHFLMLITMIVHFLRESNFLPFLESFNSPAKCLVSEIYT